MTNPDNQVNAVDVETFMHMITVLMISFGDARELEYTPSSLKFSSSRKRREEGFEIEKGAFKYASDWLRSHADGNGLVTLNLDTELSLSNPPSEELEKQRETL